MTLPQRYKKLTTWNKIGFWGSIASIAGFAYLFWPSTKGEGAKNSIVVTQSPGAIVQSAFDSSNIVQIGTVLVNRDRQHFQPPAPNIRNIVLTNLAILRSQYREKPPYVRVEFESGNSARFKVAETLGEMFAAEKLGEFRPVVSVGIAPDYPITAFYDPSALPLTEAVVSAISNYVTGRIKLTPDPRLKNNSIRFYLNGLPVFCDNGSVVIE